MPDHSQGSTELRDQVAERARDRCEYCLSPARYATQRFSVEHVLPRSKGGASSMENLALACQGCNNHKYNRIDAPDPVSGVQVPLYHPRRDRWAEHFAWSADTLLMIGLSPTGRATVGALYRPIYPPNHAMCSAYAHASGVVTTTQVRKRLKCRSGSTCCKPPCVVGY